MKIQLKSLTMINFMGESHRKTEFNLDQPTVISGANGLGKSRHMEAFTWLLFGKDSADRENYEIKTVVNGEQLRHCDPSVEAELIVDGQFLTIKRTFQERWVKPKGQAEAQYKGNDTKCMWNGVPVTVTEFQNRINKILEASVFKMLTNPLYFSTLPWKTIRERLFELAGDINPLELAEGNPSFKALLEHLSDNKKLEDYRKELAYRKSQLKKDLDEIQPRIDQTHSLMPTTNADYNAVQLEIEQIDAAIADCDRKIADVTEAVRGAYEAEQSKMNQVNDIRRQMSDIVARMSSAARDAAYQANEKRRDLEREISSTEREISSLNRERLTIERTIERQDQIIMTTTTANARLEKERNALRESVKALKKAVYDGSTICPTCGQKLPDHVIAEAEAKFNANQQNLIDCSVERGIGMNNEIQKNQETIKATQTEREASLKEKQSLVGRIQALTTEWNNKKAELANMPIVEASAVDPSTNAEWVELKNRVDSIQATINANVSGHADTSAFTVHKNALNAKRAELAAILANRETATRMSEAIKRLEEQANDLAQQIANIEKDEFTISEFTAANIEETKRRINVMFPSVKFRFFEYTKDGNRSETCIPLVNGVPFGRANTAGRINAGLEIINKLCEHYNTIAPIFLDNAESVNQFTQTNGQVIMMKVTTDPQLIIK